MADLKGGEFNKFVVVKRNDIEKYLNYEEKMQFKQLLELVTLGRMIEEKELYNKYIVINVDEPYANEVVEILKKNSHWG